MLFLCLLNFLPLLVILLFFFFFFFLFFFFLFFFFFFFALCIMAGTLPRRLLLPILPRKRTAVGATEALRLL